MKFRLIDESCLLERLHPAQAIGSESLIGNTGAPLNTGCYFLRPRLTESRLLKVPLEERRFGILDAPPVTYKVCYVLCAVESAGQKSGRLPGPLEQPSTERWDS